MDLGKFYINCNSYSEWIDIQKILFSMGYSWNGSGPTIMDKWYGHICNFYSGGGEYLDTKLVHGIGVRDILNFDESYEDATEYTYSDLLRMRRKSKLEKLNNGISSVGTVDNN